MNVRGRAVLGHVMVAAAVASGIVGMEMVFSGVMRGNVMEVSRGVPLLLIGLWWSGGELGRSMRISRARRLVGAASAASRSVTAGDETAPGHS